MNWCAVQCGSLRAYLDGELGVAARRMMQFHMRSCVECGDNAVRWSEITHQLRSMPDEPVPPFLRARLIVDARGEMVAARLRKSIEGRRNSFTKRLTAMPRLAVAVALVIAIALVFGLALPTRKGEGGTLAALAAAMDRVSTVHYVGWMDMDGKEVRLEGWMAGSFRQRISVGYELDEIKNGRNLLMMTPTSVVQRTTEGLLDEGLAPLECFTGDYWRALAADNADLDIDIERVSLRDGRTGVRILIGRPAGETIAITIDDESGLIVKGQVYSEGHLFSEIDDIQYDVEISDSLFSAEIHELAVGESVSTDEIDSTAQPDFGFEALAPSSGVTIVTDPARRVFRVFGDVRLTPSDIEISNGVVTYSGEPVTSVGE